MLKKILLKLAADNAFFAATKRVYQMTRDWYYRVIPINKKLIVFEAFRSTKYADSPRAIYDYMHADKAYKDYTFIWAFEHPEDYAFLKNDRTKLVKHATNDYYIAFARAKYWVVNGWIPLRIQKKPGQIALQCWHGTPLKRLRYDIVASKETTHQKNSLKENDEDMRRYDYLLSPSKFASKAFTTAFNLEALGQKDIIMETGYPRNDALVNATESDRKNFRKKYSVPDNKKVILYAPTWRDDQAIEGERYTYSNDVDFDVLREKLSEEYVILFRAHNLVANQFDFSKYDGFIYDVSKVDNIDELYIASDLLVTDYSSVFFDYAILSRPIIFFMYDREHYEKNLRGFYIDLKHLPGPIVESETHLISAIQEIEANEKKYDTSYRAFRKTYNYLDDGMATKRVVDKVFER